MVVLLLLEFETFELQEFFEERIIKVNSLVISTSNWTQNLSIIHWQGILVNIWFDFIQRPMRALAFKITVLRFLFHWFHGIAYWLLGCHRCPFMSHWHSFDALVADWCLVTLNLHLAAANWHLHASLRRLVRCRAARSLPPTATIVAFELLCLALAPYVFLFFLFNFL